MGGRAQWGLGITLVAIGLGAGSLGTCLLVRPPWPAHTAGDTRPAEPAPRIPPGEAQRETGSPRLERAELSAGDLLNACRLEGAATFRARGLNAVYAVLIESSRATEGGSYYGRQEGSLHEGARLTIVAPGHAPLEVTRLSAFLATTSNGGSANADLGLPELDLRKGYTTTFWALRGALEARAGQALTVCQFEVTDSRSGRTSATSSGPDPDPLAEFKPLPPSGESGNHRVRVTVRLMLMAPGWTRESAEVKEFLAVEKHLKRGQGKRD